MLHEDLLVNSERIYFVRVDQLLLQVDVIVEYLHGKVLHQHLDVGDEVAGQDRFALLLGHARRTDLAALDQKVHLLAVRLVEHASFEGSLTKNNDVTI